MSNVLIHQYIYRKISLNSVYNVPYAISCIIQELNAYLYGKVEYASKASVLTKMLDNIW